MIYKASQVSNPVASIVIEFLLVQLGDILDLILGVMRSRVCLSEKHLSCLTKYHLLSDYLSLHCIPLPDEDHWKDTRDSLKSHFEKEVQRAREELAAEREEALKKTQDEAVRAHGHS